MGVVSQEMEVSSPIPPAKLFKALVLDFDKLIPKIVPQSITSVEILQGDGGPGSIMQINFGEGSEFKFVKHRIDAIDKENLTHAYSVIEGDALKNRVEKISNEFKLEASPDGGSICKSSSKYYTIGDVEVKEEEINAGKQKALGMFKAIEAYLLANPNA